MNTLSVRDRLGPLAPLRRRLVLVVVAVALCGTRLHAAVHRKMVDLKTDHYRIRTDDDPRILPRIARHMERMWHEYAAFCDNFTNRHRRRSAQRREVTISLYARRRDYGTAESHGTGGVSMGDKIYTFLEGRHWASLLPLLQHEGWHSFLAMQVQAGVPPWANEGLAEFFETARYEGHRWHYPPMSPYALGGVLDAMRRRQTYSLEDLLRVDGGDWLRAIKRRTPEAGRQYTQAHALVEFLLRSEDCRYAPQFMDFLGRMTKRRNPLSSFRRIYGKDIEGIQRFWQGFLDDPTRGTPRIQRFTTAASDVERCSEYMVILAKIMLKFWPKPRDWPTSCTDLYARLMRPRRNRRWATTDLAGRLIFSHHTRTLRQVCRCPADPRRRKISYRLVPRPDTRTGASSQPTSRVSAPDERQRPNPASQQRPTPRARTRPRVRPSTAKPAPRPISYPFLVCGHHPKFRIVVQCERLEGVYHITAYTEPKPARPSPQRTRQGRPNPARSRSAHPQ